MMRTLLTLQTTQLAERTADAARTTVTRVLDTTVFTIARTPVTLLTLLIVALILVVTYFLSRLAQRGTVRAFTRHGATDLGTAGVAARLAGYVVGLLGLGVALQTMGLDLGALVAAGTFFAVAIAFAMQNVAQNFVSGIILLTERTIKPGDVLEVEGRVVRVTRMGLRATIARTRNEEDLVIPNSALVQNTVTNYTLRDSVYRLGATVGVSYDSDLRVVLDVLRRAADQFTLRIPDHEPRVLLTGFGDSSVDFEILVWVSDPWRARTLRSDLHEQIWWALKDAGITIPYPQRTLHMAPATEPGRPAPLPGA